MFIILGVLSILPMIYTGQFDPLSFIPGLNSSSSGHALLKAQAPKNLTNAVTDEKIQVYKWRDENGVMQFSNTPPPTTAHTEQVELNPYSNLVQAVKVPAKEEPKQIVQADSPNPYSVQGMKKVMDDARGVEELLNKRYQQQQKMIDKL